MLQAIFRRFEVLYPRLIKSQQQSFKGSTLTARLTVQDQIKLCRSLAKSESVTLSPAEDKAVRAIEL